MLSIGLVTDVPFWEIGNGQNARIHLLHAYLNQNSKLTLYYLGEDDCPFPSPKFESNDKKSQLAETLKQSKHDLLIVEKLHLDWIADLGIKNTPIYLDAHDLLSDRAVSFQQFQRHCLDLTFEEELKRFSKFDKIIFPQKEEIEKVIPFLGKDRVLLCSHPVVPKRKPPIRKKVETISFFGGPSITNIDGVQWFHDAVIPLIGELSRKCVIHGAINYSPFSMFSPRVSKGRIFPCLDSYYQHIDIAFNPVLYGSGLKVKTVEAIAYGIPLVTTSIGAQGFDTQKNDLFLVANTPEEFAEALSELNNSHSLRKQLSCAAKIYAEENFTPHACFGSLLEK
jgi:glycosyltransferase involved in cell wall biosynthesis